MKKSLLALAALSALAGVASAQSSVTVYGKMDLAFDRNYGGTVKGIDDTGAGSRIGFRGVEDLGSGLKAVFNIEHRVFLDTGKDATTADSSAANDKFWNGLSTVGLVTPYGSVNLGRQYVAAWVVQNAFDPFGGDTVGGLRYVGVLPVTGTVKDKNYEGAGVSKLGAVRVDDSVRYDVSYKGIQLAASVGEAIGTNPSRPVSFAVAYAAGPLFVGYGYENPSDAADKDKLSTFGATYDFGVAKLAASLSKGRTSADVKAKAFLIGATVPFGKLDLKAGFAKSSISDATDSELKKASIGAHYNLSKRTKVYVDYAKVGGDFAAGPKIGYDFGIQHNF